MDSVTATINSVSAEVGHRRLARQLAGIPGARGRLGRLSGVAPGAAFSS